MTPRYSASGRGLHWRIRLKFRRNCNRSSAGLQSCDATSDHLGGGQDEGQILADARCRHRRGRRGALLRRRERRMDRLRAGSGAGSRSGRSRSSGPCSRSGRGGPRPGRGTRSRSGAATNAPGASANRSHRLVGLGRHGRLAVAYGDAGQRRLRQPADQQRRASGRRYVGSREGREGRQCVQGCTEQPRSCACRAVCTSPGRMKTP